MLGFLVTLGAFAIIKTAVMRGFVARPDLLTGLVLGALVVGIVGAIDDVRSLGPWLKLGAQAVAAVTAYAFGYRIDAVNLPVVGNVYIGVLALPVTVMWFLAITNAINLIDGLDGLAAGISLFATIANFAIAYFSGAEATLILSATLGGALLGFLRFNFNPATIFLGDSGSMFLGYTLAATSISGQMTKSSTAITVLAPMIALGVPILDTLLAMIRRAIARRSIFAADRGHIHHRLLDLGFTHRRVVLTLYSMSIALAVAAVTVAIGHHASVGAALTVVGLVLFTTVRTIVRKRGGLRQQTEHKRAALQSLSESTRACIGRVISSADEAELRLALGTWSEEPHGLHCVMAVKQPEDLDVGTGVLDVSTVGRQRYLVVTEQGGMVLTLNDQVVGEALHELAEAVRVRLERAASPGNTARLHAVSAAGEK
jgi:UDP-GlcNAc:undecaprenyl-phosphate/decaprenyl-phosphate GlcNAc-1-phosphate transferase